MKLIVFPNKGLTQACKKCGDGEPPVDSILGMATLCKQLRGAGIAANQAGLDLAVCIVDIPEAPNFVMINPEITDFDEENVVRFPEACLSFPGFYTYVPRSMQIRVKYEDHKTREVKEIVATDYLAQVIQHELDHLLGKTILDYASRIEKQAYYKRLRKLGVLNVSQTTTCNNTINITSKTN